MLNMFFYLLGLMPLTNLIVTLRPSTNTTETGEPEIIMVPISFRTVSVTRLDEFAKHSIQDQTIRRL